MDIALSRPTLLNLFNQSPLPLSHSCSHLTTLFLPFRFFFSLTYASPTVMHATEFCEGYIMASLCELIQTPKDCRH